MGKKRKAIPPEKWEWFGESAHLIVGFDCRFHMATRIGKYLISTVGKYWPDSRVRAINARIAKKTITGMGDEWDWNYRKQMPNDGFDTIGCDRLYETMVFMAGSECKCGCGLPQIASSELDFKGYNDPKSAREGHMKMCRKWARGAEGEK